MLGLFKPKEKTEEKTGRVKILVVDDDAALLDTIRHRFKYCKWEVITAADGKEGLEKVESEKPDLIVVDIKMPVMNGHEMIRRLRGNRKLKDIPVIMCTMSNKVQDITTAASYNISGYITKPFDYTELTQKIINTLKEVKKR